MEINFRNNLKKNKKIWFVLYHELLFCQRHINFIFILIFIGLISLGGLIAYKYIGVTFEMPSEAEILEIQARQVKVKKDILKETLRRTEERKSELTKGLEKEYKNPFLPF